ncbi:radical SAM protein [Lachnospiraceae bacterium 48-21]
MEKCSIGCQLCIQGRKSTVHITYRCTKHCSYCPIPNEKFGSDIVEFMNNLYSPNDIDEIIKIISSSDSLLGISISGGEPLLVFDRVKDLIIRVKELRGERFHIHLYTNGDLLSKTTISELEKCGLDELRVDSLDVSIYELLRNAKFDVVCEVPCIPTEDYYSALCQLIDRSSEINLTRINLNEFEITKENLKYVRKKGLIYSNNRLDESCIYAKRVIEYASSANSKLRVFFCTYEIAEKIRIGRNRV